ncbi:DASH complex subunit Spc19 [Cladorrhinum sp. PSN332]|nr:DASH complex subunit Spc19 [Cladorrhinum sp. PSN332]
MAYNPTYADCVSNLRTSLSFLESSVQTLDQGVQDFPRITNLLKTVRHYELIPQPTLAAAEASLRDEIGPFIALLLDRAEKNLERQARRIETLKARAELNAGRLNSSNNNSNNDHVRPNRQQEKKKKVVVVDKGIGGKRLDGEQALRVKVLRQRREALKYSVERLEMEVRERERELRGRLERV